MKSPRQGVSWSQNLEEMIPKGDPKQPPLLDSAWKAILHLKHNIKWLADAIDGAFFENAFALWYANKGRLAISIRVMVGCWILKRLDHLGDETLMERWIENPTMTSFTGLEFMKHQPPCDPSGERPFLRYLGLFGSYEIALKAMRGTMSPRCSLLLFLGGLHFQFKEL
ncbi:MAG: transposase [Flavobacteriaceae bacterium]|nr:transposase [Flavobacteriaceae bacterium]